MLSALCLAALLLALAPLAPWYCARLGDGIEAPWAVALLPVLAAAGRPPRSLDLRATASLLALYALAYPFLPNLGRAALAALALAAFLSAWRGRTLEPGLVGLTLLSLPGLSSLQFYFGYPIRAFSARAAALALGVRAEGAGLVHAGRTIAVDAPCSGLKMLWVGLLLVFLLAALRRWSFSTTLRWSLLAAVSLVAGNTLRITSLFLTESGRVPRLPGVHEGVGLVVFATIVLALGYAAPAGQLAGRSRPWRGQRLFVSAVLLSGLTACFPPLRPASPPAAFPGWPTSFEGRPLTRLDDQGRFTDGARELVFRFVPEKTRTVHPAQECFQGLGYEIVPLPIEDGWGCFLATRGSTRLKVRQRVGRFPDVSEWYWSSEKGPWWAVTVAERVTEPPEH